MSSRLELIESLIEKGSKDPFVWYGRAMELRSLGRLPDALRAFESVKTQFADYVPTYLMAAQTAQSLGDFSSAETWLKEGIEVARKVGNAHALSELEALMASVGASIQNAGR